MVLPEKIAAASRGLHQPFVADAFDDAIDSRREWYTAGEIVMKSRF